MNEDFSPKTGLEQDIVRSTSQPKFQLNSSIRFGDIARSYYLHHTSPDRILLYSAITESYTVYIVFGREISDNFQPTIIF